MPIQGAGTARWQEGPTESATTPAPDQPRMAAKRRSFPAKKKKLQPPAAENARSPMAYKTKVRKPLDWHSNRLALFRFMN